MGFAVVYNMFRFDGTVIDKYQEDIPMQFIRFTSNHVIVDTWFGQKDFQVELDEYDDLEKGETYSFVRDELLTNWVTFR